MDEPKAPLGVIVSEGKHYTWEEKIESLVNLAKVAGRFTHTARGTEEYNVTREHLVRAYNEFCEWQHDEPHLVDAINALLQRELFIDGLTGVRLTIERDIPEHPRITVICPERHHLTGEQVNGAIDRLRQRAGISPAQLPDPVQARDPTESPNE